VATLDEPARQAAVLVLNRDLGGERVLSVHWEDVVPARVLACETLTGTDLKAFNTFDAPRRVAPQALPTPSVAGTMTLKLPPRSYTVVHVGL
jgi:alpha-N-arabinofuranosidase